MVRLFVFIFFLLAATAATLALRACGEREQQVSESALKIDPEIADQLVGLPDGGALVAAKGSVGRRLIDWLQAKEGRSANFEVGGREFAKGTAIPTPEGAGRIPRLIMILRAYPDVNVTITGHAEPSGNPAADMTLSRARAEFVARQLLAGGMEEARVSTRAAGASEPLPEDSPLRAGGAGNERVSLTLTRSGSHF